MPEKLSDKLPPQDLDAEQATLGAILVEAGAADRAMTVVKAEDFYREAHRVIFSAMDAVRARGEPVDLVTVGAELRRRGQLEAVGGGEYLTALIAQVPTTAHLVRYATIVAQKATLRGLIQAGAQIQAIGYDNPEDVGEALDRAEQRIFEISQRGSATDFQPLAPLVEETFQRFDDVYHRKGFLSGVSTGLLELDKMTSGLQRGDLIIVAGRPSMGKTSLLINNIALHAALKEEVPVGIFSLEMSANQLAEMILCGHAGVNSWRLRRGLRRDDDWLRIGHALSDLPKAPIYIDDTPGISILELRSKARRLTSQVDLGIIIVDYLQLASGGGRYQDSRHQEISIIARSLKSMARELNVAVVVGSQLSRSVERREEKRPILSDLAESGSIEAEADLVTFLYRESYYKRKEPAEEVEEKAQAAAEAPAQSQEGIPEKAELLISKHRNGPVGTVTLAFLESYRKFENFDITRQAEVYE